MKEKFLPWLMLICALGLSGTAAYYSVVGLSVVFIGVATPVIIMGSFLELSKIAIATYLHDKWKETYGALKIYMTIALVILSIITSLGIYGLLSTGFQGNIAKLEINEKKIKNVEVKKNRFEEIKEELTKEKSIIDNDITKLRDGLSNNTTTQSVDRRTGQVVTRANNANRLSFENQLKDAQRRRDTIASKIDGFNDSITNLDVQILDMESEEISGSELGAIKYVSELLDWDIKRTANLFILILIFVFDPLAITLVIATNQAFKSIRKKDDISPNQEEDSPKEFLKVEDNVDLEEIDSPKQKEESLKVEDNVDLEVDTKVSQKNEKPEQKIWDKVKELREEGKLPPEPTEEELTDEPTSLAFTPYEIEETDQVPTNHRPSTDEVINNDNIERFVELQDSIKNDFVEKPQEDNIDQQDIVVNEIQPKKLSYLNRDGYGKSFKINRI
jgi:hypothetical protein